MKNKKTTVESIFLILLFIVAILIPVSAIADEAQYGDVDRNGDITASDALLALQCSVGKIELHGVQYEAARVNGGITVTASDALMILQASVGKITVYDFPAGAWFVTSDGPTSSYYGPTSSYYGPTSSYYSPETSSDYGATSSYYGPTSSYYSPETSSNGATSFPW